MAEPDLRLLIVDDEPLARDCVRLALADEPGVAVAGECGDGASAVEAIRRLRPDLVLLDVQMPEADGFSVIEQIGADQMPEVVFVTAYDRYAVRAFEAQALDYVLKPFDNERLRAAIRGARKRIRDARDGELGRRLGALLRERPMRRFAVRSEDRIHFVAAAEVDWIEADGNYVVLHAGAARHQLRLSLRSVLERLDPDVFVQVHRSAVVNLEKVRELQAWFSGDYIAVLDNGEKVRVSRTRAPLVLKATS
ncbi:MAG: LytTR family DNA-binding domain-containing protein [Myxococcales bacterium]|nr:LytTR family DNA-binding domain-containing protein [Myxococcales bacterium]